EPRRMVGDRDVGVPLRAGLAGHVGKRGAASGPVRGGVQVAADLRELHELRERVCLRGVDLPAILAELGWDEIHVERGVDLLLRERGDLLTARLGAYPVQAVFVEQELSPEGQAAEPDVVLLRPRAIEEVRSERSCGDHPEIDLQSAVDDDRTLRVAARE